MERQPLRNKVQQENQTLLNRRQFLSRVGEGVRKIAGRAVKGAGDTTMVAGSLKAIFDSQVTLDQELADPNRTPGREVAIDIGVITAGLGVHLLGDIIENGTNENIS